MNNKEYYKQKLLEDFMTQDAFRESERELRKKTKSGAVSFQRGVPYEFAYGEANISGKLQTRLLSSDSIFALDENGNYVEIGKLPKGSAESLASAALFGKAISHPAAQAVHNAVMQHGPLYTSFDETNLIYSPRQTLTRVTDSGLGTPFPKLSKHADPIN